MLITFCSCIATSEIRHVQGRTSGIALEKAHIAGKLRVHILDGCTGGDDKASSMLSSHIARGLQHCDVYNEHSVQDASKQMRQYYALFPTEEEASEHPYPNMKKEELAPSGNYLVLKNFRKRWRLQLQHESEGRSFTEVKIFTKVLGMKAGYVRGLGLQCGKLDHRPQCRPLI
ncbi:hypothetical protein CJ030_MR1G014137 [Morella rubra]|uniref:Uncharacterized protein n=1 Tax=Morella rubra TaxID=262757 RepID=A0A6A1WUM0_9ROSI|nr:hypothetical protein CJ030_MR1G014137 [Morella rubra]